MLARLVYHQHVPSLTVLLFFALEKPRATQPSIWRRAEAEDERQGKPSLGIAWLTLLQKKRKLYMSPARACRDCLRLRKKEGRMVVQVACALFIIVLS
jgi:hypothetical protein